MNAGIRTKAAPSPERFMRGVLALALVAGVYWSAFHIA